MQLANEGMKVLLIDTNYNKEIEHENIVRVNNWKDIDKSRIYTGVQLVLLLGEVGGNRMIELNLENKKGKIKINSSDVKNILRLRPDFEYIQDISETINQENIMVYDCQLSRDVFNMEDIDEIKEEIGQDIDESYFDVLFEDVRAYLKDATDEIEEEIQDKYLLDNVRCYFEVYNIDETFTDFKFVFLVSFKDIKIASLTNLSKLIGKRQLTGASKFYS